MDADRWRIGVCITVAVLACVSDLATRRIPNTLTIGGIVLGLAMNGADGYADGGLTVALHGLWASVAGIAVCSLAPALSFAKGEIGGGDVKLFAAIGALLGPSLGFHAQAFTFAVALVVVLPWRLLRAGAVGSMLSNLWTAGGNLFRQSASKRPYQSVKLAPVVMAPSILAGLCLALLRHGALP